MNTTLVEGHVRQTSDLSLQLAVQYGFYERWDAQPDNGYKESLVYSILLGSLQNENNE